MLSARLPRPLLERLKEFCQVNRVKVQDFVETVLEEKLDEIYPIAQPRRQAPPPAADDLREQVATLAKAVADLTKKIK